MSPTQLGWRCRSFLPDPPLGLAIAKDDIPEAATVFLRASVSLWSDFLPRKLRLDLQPQPVRHPVGEVHQRHFRRQVHDLGFGEILLQRVGFGCGGTRRATRYLLRIAEGGFFLVAEIRLFGILERLPVVSRQPGSLRRSEVVLESILAVVDERDPDVNHLVQPPSQ